MQTTLFRQQFLEQVWHTPCRRPECCYVPEPSIAATCHRLTLAVDGAETQHRAGWRERSRAILKTSARN